MLIPFMKSASSKAQEIVKQGKKAHEIINQIVESNNIHLTEEFIELFKDKFSHLFRDSNKNYKKKPEYLEQTSRVVNYLETILHPNFRDDFDLDSLSPEIQILFFKSINEAFLDFKKKHELSG